MSIQEYISQIIQNSPLIEKSSFLHTITILLFLKEGIDKEDGEKYIKQLKKIIKDQVKDVNIEIKIVYDMEEESFETSNLLLKEGSICIS